MKMKCEEDELDVLPLHKYPELIKDCCKLINSEWPRSETLRMRSLESSNDKLPTNLVLLKNEQVVGHCKLSRIPSMSNACFIETVVIDSSLRGMGLGTFLMKKAEEYCRSFLNLDILYLSTKDQERFYSKLGYEICEPLSIYGQPTTLNKLNIEFNKMNLNQHKTFSVPINCPRPPPMPPISNVGISKVQKIYMKKILDDNIIK